MLYIKKNPKKSSWKLKKVIHGEGTEQILSGYDGYPRYLFGYRSYQNWISDIDGTVEEIDNFIFAADVAVVTFGRGNSSVVIYLEDNDGIHEYAMAASSICDFLVAVQKGKIRVEDGWYKGTFTFKKQGEGIYIFPYYVE